MYEILSQYYDKFMADVPYAEWTEYIANILRDRRQGMDVGCGTGKFTVALKKLGYDIVGSDSSAEMLAKAVEFAKKSGVDVEFVLQSADKLKTVHLLEFIVACCDVVNYLKEPVKFFARAYDALTSNGVLIFDISTEYKLKNILGNNVFTESTDDVTYVWENAFSEKRHAVDMHLTFFIKQPNNYYIKRIDEQVQYIHTEEYLTSLLKQVGFNKIEVYGFLKRRKPIGNDQRIVFVAYK